MTSISWSISKHEQLHLFFPDARTFHNIYKLQKHVLLRHQSYLIVFMYGYQKFTILAYNAPLTKSVLFWEWINLWILIFNVVVFLISIMLLVIYLEHIFLLINLFRNFFYFYFRNYFVVRETAQFAIIRYNRTGIFFNFIPKMSAKIIHYRCD